MHDKKNTNKKLPIIVFIIVGIIIVSVLALKIIDGLKSSSLNIYVTPSASSVAIDGKIFKNGTYRMYPGDYEATISLDGFQTKTIPISLESNKYTNLFAYLASEDDFSFYLEEGHLDDFAILEQIAKEDDEDVQLFLKKVEQIRLIKEKLPLVGWSEENIPETNMAKSLFRITSGDSDGSCERAACLLVSWYRNIPDEDLVKAKISQADYNFDDYQIIYREAE